MLGREFFGRWSSWEKSLPAAKGDELPGDERDAWEWLRNPLPPADVDALLAALRLPLGLADRVVCTRRWRRGSTCIAQAFAPSCRVA